MNRRDEYEWKGDQERENRRVWNILKKTIKKGMM